VTIAKRPSVKEHGTAPKMQVILAAAKAIYFSQRGWTGFWKICPTGKSVGENGPGGPLNSSRHFGM
jgi:hypothetical protein